MKFPKTIFLLISFALVAPALHAQNTPEMNEAMYLQKVWGKEKKEIIQQAMNIDKAHYDQFWDLYNKYETERVQLGLDRYQIISDYIKHYATFTNNEADDLMGRVIKND